jgi:hypothetical protein
MGSPTLDPVVSSKQESCGRGENVNTVRTGHRWQEYRGTRASAGVRLGGDRMRSRPSGSLVDIQQRCHRHACSDETLVAGVKYRCRIASAQLPQDYVGLLVWGSHDIAGKYRHCWSKTSLRLLTCEGRLPLR